VFLNQDANENFADTLGGRIIYAREISEFTTSQLADRLGVATDTLEDWESDRSEPVPDRLVSLAGMLKVSPAWLLTGAGDGSHDALDGSELIQIRSTVAELRGQVLALAEELEQIEERLDVRGN
jgi:transcriptional regulator with XRE-family HTH domain